MRTSLLEQLRTQRADSAEAGNRSKYLSLSRSLWAATASTEPALELRDLGYDVPELVQEGVTPKQIVVSGYMAADLRTDPSMSSDPKLAAAIVRLMKDDIEPSYLKKAEFDIRLLKYAGVGAPELKKAGFDLNELKERANFSAAQLRSAGFTAEQ